MDSTIKQLEMRARCATRIAKRQQEVADTLQILMRFEHDLLDMTDEDSRWSDVYHQVARANELIGSAGLRLHDALIAALNVKPIDE